MKSFSFISPLFAQMCWYNLCNLQAALPHCTPRVLSISAVRGKAFFWRGGAARFSAGQGKHPWPGLNGYLPSHLRFRIPQRTAALICSFLATFAALWRRVKISKSWFALNLCIHIKATHKRPCLS